MAQKTNLNVAPYFDDFTSSDNFHQVLFRPGFSVQARELTQLQSLLKNQMETSGRHLFKEGAMVVPGQVGYQQLTFIKLENTFNGESIDVTQYLDETTPIIITGATSGVKAKVIKVAAATTSDPATLFVSTTAAGTDAVSTTFTNGENLSANVGVTHTTSYSIDNASATLKADSATGTSGAANIQNGVYFVRGQYVEVLEETLIVSKYAGDFTGRIGLKLTESIITPEGDITLTDNAAGSSNFAAKGAHRLKISCALAQVSISSTADSDFIELLRVKDGQLQQQVRATEFGTIENTFARRTHDESGDYTVRPFQYEIKECVTVNDNEGVFASGGTTDDGAAATNDLLSVKVSPGKAYVKGYEIETIAPIFKDVNKARQTENVNAGITTFDLGNFVKITNIYGQPDISFVTGESSAYKMVELFDTPTTSRGSSAGTKIGVARARSIEYNSGTVGTNDATFKFYIFDIRPFTFLTLSGTPSPTLIANHSDGGVYVTGATTGATGFVFSDGTSGTTCILTNVTGAFQVGEKIKSSDSSESDFYVEDSGNTDLTITSIKTSAFTDVRQVFMDDVDSGQDFTADIALTTQNTDASFILLDGSDSSGSDSDDNLRMEDGTTNATSNGDNSSLERGASAGTGSAKKIAKLEQPEKNVAIFRMEKDVVKTHLTTANNGVSDTQFQVRRQYVTNASSIGVLSINAEVGETFLAHSEINYTMTILSAGVNGSAQQGDVISASTGFGGAGTNTVTITNLAALGNGAKVKIIATLLKTGVNAKSKTAKLMKQLKVDIGATDAFGTRPTDKHISLGRADVFKLVGVFDSEDTSSDAAAPTMTFSSAVNTITQGEQIIGQSSGAKARIINISSPISFVYQLNSKVFISGETVKGTSSAATGVISALTAGSVDIKSRYLLDSGQRDNFYDFGRITRKPTSEPPLGRLLVVYDYLEHGPGECFTVDSYVDNALQMEYDDIPIYSASKVDPDDPQPPGEFRLADCYDFRPRVEDAAGASATLSVVDEITGNSMDFFHRQFDGTGSSTVNFPPPGALLQSDFEFFLPKWALLHVSPQGEFIVTEGISAEQPTRPKEPNGMMKLAEIFTPAYTFRPQNVIIEKTQNQRFTMKDIGRLQDRVDNLEYYTALSLLERDAESFEIQDSNGLNRFKSGFVVDNFAGHRIGDVGHPDYKNSMDLENKELRPQHFMKGITLTEKVTTDTERAGSGYKKTGDIITLPYSEVNFEEQPFATRVERVTPVLLSNWVGNIELNPATDEWFETETAPDLIINVEGNFDTFFNQNRNAIGTVWNAWQTQWSGVVGTRRQLNTENGGNFGRPGRVNVLRSINTVRTDQRRVGVRTDIVEKIDLESQGTKVIARAIIPFIRTRNVVFEGTNFYPNTRVFAFFDKRAISEFCTPALGFSTNDESIVQGSAMVTSASGKVKGTFKIPDPKVAGNPQWQSGELQFRLTSSETNVTSIDPITAGDSIYFAQGILETEQETIIATRNAEIVRTSVNDTRSLTSQTQQVIRVTQIFPPAPRGDPLAQSFIVEETGDRGTSGDTNVASGVFITSIDLFHNAKDDAIPVWLELRNMINGLPGPKVLPFGRVTKEPSEINLSEDASVATTYTFSSPVYLLNQTEYCFVIGSSVPTHKIWISRMGETEVGGTRQVSQQPHIGVMFKGHNNRTWAPALTEDVKFTMRKAKFDIGTPGVVNLVNDTVPLKTLETNPLMFTNGSTTMLVKHRDHHMYATTNNVTLTGVKSGATTTLNGAISGEATSLTLTSGSDFDDTSGKYSRTSSNEWFIKINDEIMKYTSITGTAVTSITRAQDGTTAKSHADGSTVEFYVLHSVPLTEINKTHTSLGNINIDSYTLTLTSAPVISGASTTAENGGTTTVATENAVYNVGHCNIATLEVENTKIEPFIQSTTGTSPSGIETSFAVTAESAKQAITLDENIYFEQTQMVCSDINESNELAGTKSLTMPFKMTSTNVNVSPMIDMGRSTFVAIANRVDNIDSSSDVFPTENFIASTEPDGDNNSAIYICKKVALENSATALKVFFAGYKHSTADIKLMYKILRSDDASDFDDLGWVFFNSDGSPDTTVNTSLAKNDFQEYVYTAGVTDDGSGSSLDEFIAFSIKIVMQSTNSSQPPRIKDLRCIALAT